MPIDTVSKKEGKAKTMKILKDKMTQSKLENL